MTIDELVASYEVDIKRAKESREDLMNQARTRLDAVKREGRTGFTATERAEVDGFMKRVNSLDVEIDEYERKLSQARVAQAEEIQLAALNDQRIPTGVASRAYDMVGRVGMEARTYSPGTDKDGRQFLSDVGLGAMGDYTAAERLQNHMREERVERGKYLTRAVGTGGFAGLVVPQYLTDLYAPRAQAMRPFANSCNRHNLPSEGMTVNISRITTGTGVGLQATENTSVTNTPEIDDTLLTETVQTAAGQQTLSRQAVERGAVTEEVTLQDLFAAYATTLDSTLINQATTGLSAVSQAVAYTDATATAAELWPKIFEAQNTVENVLLGRATTSHVVMHPRRWNWLTSQVGTSFPFMATASTPTNRGGVLITNEYGDSVRGVLSNGLKVVVDANIATNKGAGTNEDEIYVVASDEAHLWEDPQAPVFIRADQPAAASLGVLFVVYGYFAYSFRRYATGAFAKVAGTGLITPVFA